jgi:hypothetical protein
MKRGRFTSAIIPMLGASAVALGVAAATATAGTSRAPVRASTASASRTVVYNCLKHTQVRPKSFVFTCADSNNYLSKLSWSNWTPTLATATGNQVVNDCLPTCVKGKFHSYRAVAIFWRKEPVAHHPGEKYFTRVTLLYPAAHPPAYKHGKPVPGPDSSTGSLWS